MLSKSSTASKQHFEGVALALGAALQNKKPFILFIGDDGYMVTRVMIVEKDIFTRTILVSAVQYLGYEVVIEESKPQLAISQARATKPEAAIIDLHLGPGSTGIDIAVALRKRNPKVGLVLLAKVQDPRLVNAAIPPWPKGTVYLTKDAVVDIDRLQLAIKQSLGLEGNDGHEPLAATTTKRLAFGKLTVGQIETLRLISRGLSNSAIADQGFVKERSIEQTISRIAKVLGVKAGPHANQRVCLARFYFRAMGLKTEAVKSEAS